MKILLEIKNEAKIPFIMEFLKSQPYIKAKPFSETVSKENLQIIRKLKKASSDLSLYKKGKLKTINAKDFLNEL